MKWLHYNMLRSPPYNEQVTTRYKNAISCIVIESESDKRIYKYTVQCAVYTYVNERTKYRFSLVEIGFWWGGL